MSPISLAVFPEEIVLKIFDHLNPKELAISGQVCRKWYELSQDYTLWKKFTLFKNNHANFNWKKHVVTEILSHPILGLYPLNQYIYLFNGFQFHSFPLQAPFQPGIFKYGSRHEITSRITSICPYTNFTQEEIPTREVKIFAGSEDRLIRLWTITDQLDGHFKVERITTMSNHGGPVTQIKMRGDYIFSYGDDQRISIWKIIRNQKLRMIDIQVVKTVRITKGKLTCLIPLTTDFHQFSFLVSIDKRIERYQVDKQETVSREVIFTSKEDRITQICKLILKQNVLFSGSSSGELRVWETDLCGKTTCIQIVEAHPEGISALVSHPFKRQIISGSVSGEICVWEKQRESEPWVLNGRFHEHGARITCLKFGRHLGVSKCQTFFSISEDNTLISWEYDHANNKYAIVTKLHQLIAK